MPALAGGASGLLTYIAEVRQDASPGDAINLASAVTIAGPTAAPLTLWCVLSAMASASVSRSLAVSRKVAGAIDPREAAGIAGIRVMLQERDLHGYRRRRAISFRRSDPGYPRRSGRSDKLSARSGAVDCAQNTRSAGSAISRFVEGRGGSLKRADFRAVKGSARQDNRKAPIPLPAALRIRGAAGAEHEWFAGQARVPASCSRADHNPRVRSIRVAVKYLRGKAWNCWSTANRSTRSITTVAKPALTTASGCRLAGCRIIDGTIC